MWRRKLTRIDWLIIGALAVAVGGCVVIFGKHNDVDYKTDPDLSTEISGIKSDNKKDSVK